MIVDHADGLHEGIANRRTNESEPATLEIFTERIGLFRTGRDFLERVPPVDSGPAIHEFPDIGVEASEFLLHI